MAIRTDHSLLVARYTWRFATITWMSAGCLIALQVTAASAAVTSITSPWGGGTVASGNTVVLDEGASVTGGVSILGTLQFANTGTLNVPHALTGSGSIAVTGGGTLNITGENAPSVIRLDLSTSVNAGTLNAGLAGSLDLSIGENGPGSLTVGGGLVQNHVGFIGQFGSTGTATVSSGTWRNSGDLFVGGDYGTGAVIVSGGQVSNSSAYLGYSGGVGLATVSGGEWATADTLRIGTDGSGSLLLTGGRVASVGALLGVNAGGRGLVLVQGGTWSTSGTMRMGGDGDASVGLAGGMIESNAVNVISGSATVASGTWNSGSFSMGVLTGTTHLSVTGGRIAAGSTLIGLEPGSVSSATIGDGAWESTQTFSVGERGVGTVRVLGGALSSPTVVLGNGSGVGELIQSGGTLGVTSWSEGAFTIGGSGTGVFRLSGGHAGVSYTATIGSDYGGSGSVIITGGTWRSQGVRVGNAGTGRFEVNGGELVAPNGGIVLGEQSSGRGDLTMSTGWLTCNSMNVGVYGVGAFHMTGGTAATSYAHIGAGSGGSGTASIQGGAWTMNTAYIGQSGQGILNISGGSVVSGATTIGVNGGGSGVASLSDGSWLTGELVIGPYGFGRLAQTGGLLTSNGVTLAPGDSSGRGQVEIAGGSWINSGQLTVGASSTGSLVLSGGTMTTVGTVLGDRYQNNYMYSGYSRGSGTATVTGGRWINAGAMTIGNTEGNLICSGGVTTTDSLRIGASTYGYYYGWQYRAGSGIALVSGGTLSVRDTLGIGTYYNANPSGHLTIADQGVVSVGGSVDVGVYGSIALRPGGTLIVGTGSTAGYLNTALVNEGHLVLSTPSDISHGYALSGGGAFTKRGTGGLTMNTAFACTGTTTVEGGLLRITTGSFASPAIVNAGCSLQIDAGVPLRSPSITLLGGTLSCPLIAVSKATGIGLLDIQAGQVAVNAALSIADSGSLRLSNITPSSMAVQSLTLSATTGGCIDIGRGRLTIAAGGISSADLRTNLLAGRGDGTWNGLAGIVSTAAGATPGRSVGYRVLANNSAIIAFAAYGDCTLDGQVNSSDINLIINAGLFGKGGTSATWSQGDFNYDGLVDELDIVELLSADVYGKGAYNTAAQVSAAPSAATAFVAVPEPEHLSALLVIASFTLAWNWRTASRVLRRPRQTSLSPMNPA